MLCVSGTLRHSVYFVLCGAGCNFYFLQLYVLQHSGNAKVYWTGKLYQPDSLYLSPHDKQLFELLKHNKKIGLFCINDEENISNEERIFAKNFLQEMFPQKSSFENL